MAFVSYQTTFVALVFPVSGVDIFACPLSTGDHGPLARLPCNAIVTPNGHHGNCLLVTVLGMGGYGSITIP